MRRYSGVWYLGWMGWVSASFAPRICTCEARSSCGCPEPGEAHQGPEIRTAAPEESLREGIGVRDGVSEGGRGVGGEGL